MADTPPSDPSALRVQTNISKKQSEGRTNEAHEEINQLTTLNGGDHTGPSLMPFAGEMERRGEEKLLDERIRERYQKEIGDIFNDS